MLNIYILNDVLLYGLLVVLMHTASTHPNIDYHEV